MNKKCAVFWLFLLYSFQPLMGLVCQPDLLSDGHSVITLSDELSDAYTAEERCEELGGYLSVTREADVKQIVTDGAKSKYSGDLQRIWIYYDSEHPNGTDLYQYTLSPENNESKWFSTQVLGQTWYIDLYNSSSNTSNNPISFCRYNVTFETWLVEDSGVTCSPGWDLVFKFYTTYSPTDPRFKEIYKYYSLSPPITDRLTAVDEPYRTSISKRGQFRAPVTDVLIGARFNPVENQWYWNDGVVAPEFTDRGFSTCQQKVWSHLVNEELTTNCNQTKSFYSCQTKFFFNVTKFECNSTSLDIRWNMWPLANKFSKTLTVHIVATNDAVSPTTLTVTDKNSTILSGLTPRLEYSVTVTANLGCDDITNVTSLQQVLMGQGIPDEIINSHVIKSGESCQMNFMNPLPGEQFNFDVGIKAITGKILEYNTTSEYCDDSFCQLPIDMSEFVGLGELRFAIIAFNCEGSTENYKVAGNCINPAPPKACQPSLQSRGDSIISLSDSLASPAAAASTCLSLGGALARFNESQLSRELYSDITDKYLFDIQRVWIYRMKSDNQTYKYSFSDTPEEDWEAPTESDHLAYVDLYNRNTSDRHLLYFCVAKRTAEKWEVRTTSCDESDWQLRFSLYGKLTAADGFKKIWLFVSDSTRSVKLKSSDSEEPGFTNIGEFYVPDIHVHTGEITSADPLCPTVQYQDSWTTLTNCTDDPAYYACSIPFLTKVEPIACNSSVLIVSWEDNLSGLQTNIPGLTVIKVVIRNEFQNFFNKIEAQYSELSVSIYDFPQRAQVEMQVEVVFEGCFSDPVSTNLVGDTSYGLADPVKDTKIENPTTTCTIVMPPDESGNLLSYTVISVSENNSTYQDYDLTVHEPGLYHRMNISMEYHGIDTRINLRIRAATCEGTNEWTEVPGYCMVEGPEPFPTAVVVGSICGGLAAIGLLVGVCYCCGRKKKEKDTKESEPEYEVIGNKGAISLELPATTTTVEHF